MTAIKIIGGAIFLVVERRIVLIKALWLLFFLYVVLDLVEATGPPAIVSIAVTIAGVLVQSLIAVTTHRVILLPPNAVPEWGLRRWSARESSFVLQLLIVGLCAVPAAVLVVGGVKGLAAIALVCTFWVMARLSLAFPAIAVDRNVSVAWSWRATREHQWLMLIVVVVFPGVLAIPVLSSSVTVVAIAALSLAYREIQNQDVASI